MRRSIIVALGLLALAPSANAETHQISVHVTEAELATADGVATAYAQIEAAAERACRTVYSDPLGFYYLKQSCASETLADAIAATSYPALQAYHAAHLSAAPAVEIAAR